MKKNKLDIAKNLLSSGELVIFPTETVFGIGADATNDEAVKSIFKVKKRPRSNPIICHFKSIKQIEKYFILNKFEKKILCKSNSLKTYFIPQLNINAELDLSCSNAFIFVFS